MIVRVLSDLTWLPLRGGGRKLFYIIILLFWVDSGITLNWNCDHSGQDSIRLVNIFSTSKFFPSSLDTMLLKQ